MLRLFYLALVLIGDVGAYRSVPPAVKTANDWALLPAGGYVLVIAHHYGSHRELIGRR